MERLGEYMAEEEFVPMEDESTIGSLQSREKVKHLIIGSPAVVRRTIQILHTKGYAEANFWSTPVLAGGLGEKDSDVLCILIKHLLME